VIDAVGDEDRVAKHVGILEDVDVVITARIGRVRECRLGRQQQQDATMNRPLPARH
jgi:hypothetical protein